MARYRIVFAKSFGKELADLADDVKRRIDKKILELSENPRPPGAKKLQGEEDLHRIRIGDYRLVYSI